MDRGRLLHELWLAPMGMSLVEEKEADVAGSARSRLMACIAVVAAAVADGGLGTRDLVELKSDGLMSYFAIGASVGVGDLSVAFGHRFQVGPHTQTGRLFRIYVENRIRDSHSDKNGFLSPFPDVLINTITEVESIRPA